MLIPLALFCALPLAAQVRTLTFQEMVSSAGTIFVGTVTDVHGGTDEHGDIVTYTTFRIEQPILGASGSTILIKQLGGNDRGLSNRISHMRYFQKGEHLMVMLYPESDLGFTSPVGLSQGVWSVGADGTIPLQGTLLQGLGGLSKQYGIDPSGKKPASRAAVISLINGLRKGGAAR